MRVPTPIVILGTAAIAASLPLKVHDTSLSNAEGLASLNKAGWVRDEEDWWNDGHETVSSRSRLSQYHARRLRRTRPPQEHGDYYTLRFGGSVGGPMVMNGAQAPNLPVKEGGKRSVGLVGSDLGNVHDRIPRKAHRV